MKFEIFLKGMGHVLCPIHTADADERVGGVYTNSQLVGDSFIVSSV